MALGDMRVRANRLKKFTVNLSSSRSDSSLVAEGVIPGRLFISMVVMDKGTGTFSFKFKFSDGSISDSFTQDEILNGDVFDIEFVDLLFTNTSQQDGTVNPKFLVAWREVK